MQEVSEACSLEDDDMADGDLGDGSGVRTVPSSTTKSRQSFSGVTESLLPAAERLRRCSQAGEAAWFSGLKTAETQQACFKLPSSAGSVVDLSKEELKERLQEATTLIDVLCCELEAAHRYLEGKYEALKILQGKAILEKATTHTKSLLQKSEETAKALEREVNSLQWELSFNQLQTKKCQQSWEQKYNRISSENKTLTNSLEEREAEVQQLRTENSALRRQCLELLSMLSVKEQRAYQGTKPQYSPDRDASVLELAVLGACRCLGVAEACPCSRTAAASRKQLIQLQQELDAQCSRREEAVMVADAFRIAFEQQLRKRSEHFLLLAEANILKSHQCKAEGAKRSPIISVSQSLRGLLPSSLEVKMPDDLLETLYRLLDLLNDKEEALAHQRKVSIMLAHNAEELQKQLSLDPHCRPSDPSESRIPSEQPPDPSESRIPSEQPPDPSESRIPSEQPPDPSESRIPSEQPPDPSESRIPSEQPPDPSESRIPSEQPPDPSESRIPSEQPPDPSESRIPSEQPPDPSESRIPSEQPPDPSESRIPSEQPPDPSESRIPSEQPPDPSESRIPSEQPPDPSESRIPSEQPPDPSESRIPSEQPPDPSESRIPSEQPPDPSESRIPSEQPPDPSESRIPSEQPPDPSESRIPSEQPPDTTTDPSEDQSLQTSDISESEIQLQLSSESNIQAQQQLELPDSQFEAGQPPSLSRIGPQELSHLSQTGIHAVSNHKTHKSEIQQSEP